MRSGAGCPRRSGRSRSRSTRSTACSNTIRAGDRVDILAAFNATSATTGSGMPRLEPFMRNVRIMQNTGASVIIETTDRRGREAGVRRRQRQALVPAAAAGRRDRQQGLHRQPGIARAGERRPPRKPMPPTPRRSRANRGRSNVGGSDQDAGRRRRRNRPARARGRPRRPRDRGRRGARDARRAG